MANNTSVLDQLCETLTRNPKNLLILVLGIVGLCFSTPSIIVGLLVFVVLRLLKARLWLIIILSVLGGASVLGEWLSQGISFHLMQGLNHYWWQALIQNNKTILWNLFIWLSSFPYAILFGSGLTLCSYWQQGLQKEVQRVAKGQLKPFEKTLSKERIQRLMTKIKHSAAQDGTILGIDRLTGNEVILDDQNANLHTLVVGTTGSGKTTGIGNIVESAILRQLPLFYVDGKGDLNLARRIQQFAKSQNRPFYLFSMVGESLKYNPVAFGGFTSKKDRIIELRHWSEDHYRKLAEGYLQTIFKILSKIKIDVDLHTLAKHLEPKMLYLVARQLNDSSLVTDIESLENKRKDIESLVAEIENITNSEIGHLFDCSQGEVISLENALSEKAVVYFCLQPLAYPAYATTLGKLIINDIKSLAAAQLLKEKVLKLYVIFDEFSVFAGEQIVNLINQGRGAGIHAILSTQSISDIQKQGGESLLGQVLNNTNNYIIQRQNYPGDADILANVIGTKDAFQITSQISSQDSGVGLGTARVTKEFMVHPDEIKRLTLGQAIVAQKQLFLVKKVQIRKGAI